MSRVILEEIINHFEPGKFTRFFRDKNNKFAPREESYREYDEENFVKGTKLGEIVFDDAEKVVVITFEAKQSLSEKTGKRTQYEKGKKILKEKQYDAGIFVFYDSSGNFRFSLIYTNYLGRRRDWSVFRRFTYFVGRKFTNKTFIKQIGEKDFSSLEKIKEAFSISAVTDIFYNDFFVEYNNLVEAVINANSIEDRDKARDFVLLFTIRTIFLGFIQKKRWIGDDENFVQNLLNTYKNHGKIQNTFYKEWVSPLYFESFNHEYVPRSELPKEINAAYQMAPYLNGGLFKKKDGFDNQGWLIPDKEITKFFDYIFSHSFTIEENSLGDEDLQLNPEFLGIIFERLVNKANGAVYTPRTEVDLMCRLTLVKWLQKNLKSPIRVDNLYELFFREGKDEQDQKEGSFSPKEAGEVIELLETLSICDPAVGSGAFLVGMVQVLDDVEQKLRRMAGMTSINDFERKKRIISQSLYGVEVKEWAVWICQLRLWLSLFIDAPDELRNSLTPILPSLDFKVRQGDSLIQRVGNKLFPVSGHSELLSSNQKRQITELKNFKIDYFNNKIIANGWDAPRQKELSIYREILDSEIREKENELRILKNIKPIENLRLFGGEAKPDQMQLEINTENIERLELEIEELKGQKVALSKDKPLVWSIEFVEIFAEKGGFDIVIGNPPYVRQEDIADPMGKIKDKKVYKDLLSDMVKLDFPNAFSRGSKINAQSDLYTYFYIRGLRLLNPTGIHTFICSNSWLDVGYGIWLQKFLLERAPIDMIIDNHAKRSFEAADVNTIISIIHAPLKDRKSEVTDNHIVRFVAFKKPFDEAVFTENLLQIESASEVYSNNTFRVYPITNKELKESGTEYESESIESIGLGQYIGDKWGGKYLRAPDVFFTILDKGKEKLVKLSDVAEVRFGIKTGVNEFFYLTDKKISFWKIEKEFIKSVMKSPKESSSIYVKPEDLVYKLFICNKDKNELVNTNALKYIKWGENQEIIIKQGKDKGSRVKGFQNISSVGERKDWYSLGKRNVCKFIVPCSFNDSFKVFINSGVFVDKRLYEGYSDYESLPVILNSILFPLFMELGSRVALGEGLLDVTVDEVQKIKCIDPRQIHISEELLPKRDIKSVFEECGIDPKSDIPIEKQEPHPLPDRMELDNVVFEALNLSLDERKDVYRAVCRLVWNRISKAQSI